MPDKRKINCPGGIASQTGSAAFLRCPDYEIVETIAIEKLEEVIDVEDNPFCAPIWNSNIGEIPKSLYIWNRLVNNEIKIQDIWAKEIEFWHIKRSNHSSSSTLVGSVEVVTTQCANYMRDKKLELLEYKLSSYALEAYKNNLDGLQGAIIAPVNDMDELKEFEVVSKNTVISNNFTSFVKFQSHKKSNHNSPANFNLTAIVARPLEAMIGESEKEFFDNIFSNIRHIDDVPRLIFVLDRGAKMGLLFESEMPITIEDVLDVETIEKEEIFINSDAGTLQEKYTNQLKSLLDEKFPLLTEKEFLVHEGSNTCIFICPILNIFAHGYKKETVEPVIRFYISNFFQSIYDGVSCNNEQKKLFNKHKDAWIEKKSDFVNFEVIT